MNVDNLGLPDELVDRAKRMETAQDHYRGLPAPDNAESHAVVDWVRGETNEPPWERKDVVGSCRDGGGVKLSICSDEAYPHLFIKEPDEYSGGHYEVPDDLGQAVLAAQAQLHVAEQALLRWLRDEAGLSPESDILDDHLDEDVA